MHNNGQQSQKLNDVINRGTLAVLIISTPTMSMKQDSVDDSTTVATCRQTVEASLATPHRLAADGYHSESKGIRQSVEEYALNRSKETNP